MFRVSKLTDYGTALMTYLAHHSQAIHTARDITEKTHIALPTVSKLLKLLAKQGLLVSSRGSKGGYGLARPPQQITVAEMIAALEGGFGMTECSYTDSHCGVESWCVVRGSWQLINERIRDTLTQLTLADMVSGSPSADGIVARIPVHSLKRAL